MQKLVNEDILIQPITFNDLNEVLQTETVSFKDPWTKGMFMREIGSNNFYTLREKNTNQLIGYFGYWQIFEEFHINNLAVVPEFRGQGIGSFILDNVFSEARKRNCQKIILEVRSTNYPAQRLYFKFGFEIVGKRNKYYANGEDALILEKKIS